MNRPRTIKRTLLSPALRTIRFLYHDLAVTRARTRRAMSTRPSLLAVHPGQRRHPGGVHAIFLIWQPQGLPWYVENALAALDEAGVNVVLVVNHHLEGERLATLVARSERVLIRDNSGFDIGGYRDATLHLLDQSTPNRLIYLNDSIFCFREGLAPLFRRIAQSDADVAAPFENHEYTYHVQSFCLSLSTRVIASEAFQRFWHDYLPVNSRLWAINEGEIGLSRAIAPFLGNKEIFYTPDALRPHLKTSNTDALRLYDAYLPRLLRMGRERVDLLGHAELVDAYCERIAVRSQIHTGAFFYQQFLGCPLMKRDLNYRLQFSLDEIAANLASVGRAEHVDDIISEMRAKGTGRDLSAWNYLRFAEGIL